MTVLIITTLLRKFNNNNNNNNNNPDNKNLRWHSLWLTHNKLAASH